MIHASYETPPERAGNASVDAIATPGAAGELGSVTLEVQELGERAGRALAFLTLSEAEAVAAMLRAAAAEAGGQ